MPRGRRKGKGINKAINLAFPLSGKVAKSSISEVLPIEDKTSSVNFVDSFPKGEAKKGKPLDEAIKKPSPWGEGAERKRSE